MASKSDEDFQMNARSMKNWIKLVKKLQRELMGDFGVMMKNYKNADVNSRLDKEHIIKQN